jgi:hypothetical protein
MHCGFVWSTRYEEGIMTSARDENRKSLRFLVLRNSTYRPAEYQ